jgi:hypothetical protein
VFEVAAAVAAEHLHVKIVNLILQITDLNVVILHLKSLV